MVAVVHLDRTRAQRQRQHLMPKTDAEQRQIGLQNTPDHRDGILAGRCRITGTVGQEHAFRLQRQHVFGGGTGGKDGDFAPRGGKTAQDVALGTVIDCNHAQACALTRLIALRPGPAHLIPAIALGAGDIARQVKADQTAPGARFGHKGGNVELSVRIMGQRHMRRALLANGAGQAAGVDPAHADAALGGQPLHQIARGAPVRRFGRVPFHDQAGGNRIGRLVIFGGDADVADMREGEGHDLPGIGRIGHDFLIAGHRGVEDQFCHRLAGGAKALSEEHGAVRKGKAGSGAGSGLLARGGHGATPCGKRAEPTVWGGQGQGRAGNVFSFQNNILRDPRLLSWLCTACIVQLRTWGRHQ